MLSSDRRLQQASGDGPFQFLQDIEPETLVPFVEREHPQTIALVLSHLPPGRAGHVLARLPASTQAEVIRRMVDLEETDPQVVRDVERAVEVWLQNQKPQQARGSGHCGGIGDFEFGRRRGAAANSQQSGGSRSGACAQILASVGRAAAD